jgi:hypothetical protein
VVSLILLAYVLVGAASFLGLAINHDWSAADRFLKFWL